MANQAKLEGKEEIKTNNYFYENGPSALNIQDVKVKIVEDEEKNGFLRKENMQSEVEVEEDDLESA